MTKNLEIHNAGEKTMTSTHTNLTYIKALLANVIILAMLLISSSQTVLAAVPQSINYQGFLADDSGVPIDATHNITFRIYTASSGGSAVYTSSQSVAIVDGRFDTELGSSPNFPANLFDGTQLFLGLEIDADGEMSPRQLLSSTPFAYKAEDADTVGGVSAASLDQSAHVGNTSNPHVVTAAQVGAATATDLSDHEADSTNPHNVTDVQTGAASNLSIHAANSSVHHTKFTNTEAVSAMGAVNNSNPYNHTRYADGNAVSAVLAADGAGSTIDADLIDGMQASELIDAASDEVRTPISSLPFTINSSGSYYLTGNLTVISGHGISLTASNVTIDFMGFTIASQETGVARGISLNGRENVTIKNGTILGFGNGIYSEQETERNIQIDSMRILNSVDRGVTIRGSGHQITNSIVDGSGGIGLSLGINTANIISGMKVRNNTVSNNGSGIIVGSGSFVSKNNVYSNDASAIVATGPSCFIEENNIYNNSFGSGSNSFSAGVKVKSDSLVRGNTIDNNGHQGIYVEDDDSLIDNNRISDTPTSIRFVDSGSAYRNNTASGFTTAFISGSAIDLGGNVSF